MTLSDLYVRVAKETMFSFSFTFPRNVNGNDEKRAFIFAPLLYVTWVTPSDPIRIKPRKCSYRIPCQISFPNIGHYLEKNPIFWSLVSPSDLKMLPADSSWHFLSKYRSHDLPRKNPIFYLSWPLVTPSDLWVTLSDLKMFSLDSRWNFLSKYRSHDLPRKNLILTFSDP